MKSSNSIVFIICALLYFGCAILQYLAQDGLVPPFLYAGAGIIFLVSAWQARKASKSGSQFGIEGAAIVLSKESSLAQKAKFFLVLIAVVLVFACLGYLVGKTLALYL